VTTTETPLDLEAIELDLDELALANRHRLELIARDVPLLIAEVRRLRARVENHHCGGRAAADE
jgi:hypothetical protein